MRVLLWNSVFSIILLSGCPAENADSDDSNALETDTQGLLIDTAPEDTAPPEIPEPDYGTIVGSVLYEYEMGGAPICDTLTAFSGSSYTGECENCEFAFLLNSSIVEENGAENCERKPFLQLWNPDGYSAYSNNIILKHQTSISGGYGSYNNNALSVAASWVSYYGYEYVYTGAILGYDGSESGTWSRIGNSISWTYEEVGTSDNLYLFSCDGWTSSPNTLAIGTESLGSIQCPGYVDETYLEGTLDVWSFSAAAGDAIQISADTVDIAKAGDLRFWINGPESCTLFYADDSFVCAFGYDGWGYCPGVSFVASNEGDYQVIVDSYSCYADNTEIDYSLVVGIDGQESVSMTLDEDNAPRYTPSEYRYYSTGEALITPPS